MLNLHKEVFQGAEVPAVHVSMPLADFFKEKQAMYLLDAISSSLNFIYSIEAESQEALVAAFRAHVLTHIYQAMFQHMPGTAIHEQLRNSTMAELESTFAIFVREHDRLVFLDKLDAPLQPTTMYPYFYGSLFFQKEH